MENRTTPLFLGQFEHGIDDKSRLFLPARFREKNPGQFIMTQGLERCLFLFPPAAWDSLAARLDQLPLKNKVEERSFKRMLLSGASEVEIDAQGRILIPQPLREYAGLKRDVVIIGVLRHAEIWSKERWTVYQRAARRSFEKAAPHLEL